jgi:hypothetical protein
MLFYCQSRGLNEEEAVALVVNGFVRDVLQQLPMEFMAETQKLIGISLEGAPMLISASAFICWIAGEAILFFRRAGA